MTARVIRAILLGLFLFVMVPIGVSASSSNNPVLSSVDGIASMPVAPGQAIVLHGNHFSSDLVGFQGDCSLAGPPTVVFRAFPDPNNGGGDVSVQPATTNSSDCSDTMAKVTVPNGIANGGAFILLLDPQGHPTSTAAPNLLPMITLPIPVGGPTPSSGQVGTVVTLSGPLQPASAVANSLSLNVGSVAVAPQTWTPTSIRFAPGNHNGTVTGAMTVRTDGNDASKKASLGFTAGRFTFLPPSLTGVSPDRVHVGDRVTINGANLGTGGSIAFAPGIAGQGISWSSSQLFATVPAGAQDGALSVSVNGWGPVSGSLNTAMLPLVGTASPGSGAVGASITVSGYNFGSNAGTLSVGDVKETVSRWSDTSITFTIGGDTDPASVTITRADGEKATGAAVDVVPKLTQLETNDLAAGAQVLVDGIGLGSQPGTVQVGSKEAQILLWSRNSVLVQLPADLKAGEYPLTVKNVKGTLSNTLKLRIIPAPPSPSPGSNASPGAHPTPVYDENHKFVKPIQPPSPVSLSLAADPHETTPGGQASLTVTLKLKGQPLSGAAIKLSMLYSPGDDYQFSPAEGTTDADGTFHSTVRISKKPGDSVILAESGVFSDQDHVTGKGESAAGKVPILGGTNPASWTGALPFVGLGAVAVLLLTLGALINIRSMGSGRWL